MTPYGLSVTCLEHPRDLATVVPVGLVGLCSVLALDSVTSNLLRDLVSLPSVIDRVRHLGISSNLARTLDSDRCVFVSLCITG